MADYPALFRLDGRVALVTGAGAGIGAATAEALAAAGAHVVVTDVDLPGAEGVAAGLARGEAIHLDVTDEARVDAVVDDVVARHGRLDVLVNNVGAAARAPTVELETERWQRVLELGPTATFWCARAAGRHMLEAGSGAVVNVASIMGLVGSTFYPNVAYHSAKGALVNMTRALACEWGPSGVRVNAVAPTFSRTALTERLFQDRELERDLLEFTPMRRFVEPSEVAAAILFLASDAASMVTGVTLPVDGGWTAR